MNSSSMLSVGWVCVESQGHRTKITEGSQATHNQGMEWLKAAIDRIPDEAATASDRTLVLKVANDISQGSAAGGGRCVTLTLSQVSCI